VHQKQLFGQKLVNFTGYKRSRTVYVEISVDDVTCTIKFGINEIPPTTTMASFGGLRTALRMFKPSANIAFPSVCFGGSIPMMTASPANVKLALKKDHRVVDTRL
jgi:hypothetical protein